ncbi:MAG: bifunctional nuclease family protein [Clostridia bacterium]
MIEMELITVGMAPKGDGNVLVLREVDGERMLILAIGFAEASSIAMAAEEVPTPRPMTHDLMVNLIHRLGGSLIRVVVHDMRDDTFIGQIEVDTENGVLEIDARPSDSIALAVREGCPIYVSDMVLELAAVTQDMIGDDREDLE